MIHIVWNEAECNRITEEGRDSHANMIFEMMNCLGLACRKWDPSGWIRHKPAGLTIVIGGDASSVWTEACASYCGNGNALLAIGGLYGLEDILAVAARGSIHEGWVEWEQASPAAGLRSSFHFFHALRVEIVGSDLESWGWVIPRGGTADAAGLTPAVTVRPIGKGYAALIGIDLMKTCRMIQQGIAVVRDGHPAPDGTGAVDDGILKTDDGSVLDWHRDRRGVEPNRAPYHSFPIVDEWRTLLMRIVRMLADRCGIPFGQVWHWPHGLPAIGHISHDTDRNSREDAAATLDVLADAGIRSTWCIIMPGYDAGINARIVDEGHEVALHFNALGTEISQSHWQEDHFRLQLEMLKAQFPGREIVSNKNHYLRWEGDVQFYQWCEKAGIKVEQSKGGTKPGNKGFLAGTCHPFRPQSAAHENNRMMDVLNLPTLAWDPPEPSRCTADEMRELVDRCCEVSGVAHFLFHPYAVNRPGSSVADMLKELIRYGRDKGMEWWTSEQIWSWFATRLQIGMELSQSTGDRYQVTVVSEQSVRGATLLLNIDLPESAVAICASDGNAYALNRVERFGCRYAEAIVDLAAGSTVFTLGRTVR